MKIKSGYVLKELGESYIVVPVGDRVKEFNGVVNLNESGAFLWKSSQDEIERDKLIDKLMKEYEIDKETATRGVNKFIETLMEEGFVD